MRSINESSILMRGLKIIFRVLLRRRLPSSVAAPTADMGPGGEKPVFEDATPPPAKPDDPVAAPLPTPKTSVRKTDTPAVPISNSSRGRSKNGIRLLQTDDDLEVMFGVKKEALPEVEDFAQMLAASWDETGPGVDGADSSDGHRRRPRALKTYPPPQAELDLHGLTANVASARVGSFIARARWQGLRTLRIIVGKGIHSPGPAVLPPIVEAKIVELKKKQAVLTFRWERRGKRLSGSLIVYLPWPEM